MDWYVFSLVTISLFLLSSLANTQYIKVHKSVTLITNIKVERNPT
jgi:hypothetical protein